MQNKQQKKILILTTGGTIAGSAEDSLQSAQYTAGTIQGSDLLKALPPIQEDLSIQEIAQIDSIEMNAKIWQDLLLALKQDYDGFVITHGTDTMEESSFLIDLLYQGDKPVVFVGSMRPSNALGSDGAKNLCNAIALASNPHSQGVMVLMNDKIYHPKNIYKAHTHNLDAFKARNGGEIGYVLDSKVRFFSQVKKSVLPFEIQDLNSLFLQPLPSVEIVYLYAGIRDLPSWKHKISGLVIAGCGAGNIPSCIQEKLQILREEGIQIVACSRGSEGFVYESEFIPSYGLSIAKARILLWLCLQFTQKQEEIRAIFEQF